MRQDRIKNLQEKGWQEAEIRRAQAILDRASLQSVHFAKIVFISSIVLTIFANLIVSLILIPILIVLNQIFLYSIIILLGLTIGYIYNFLVRDIDHLEKKHHIIAGILLPIIGLINMLIMVYTSNNFIADLTAQGSLQNAPHNPWTIASIFMITFILPYLFSKIYRHMKGQEQQTVS